MTNTESEYKLGVDETLNAMERISLRSEGNPVASLSGVITTAMHAALGMAPNKKEALRLIHQCKEFALDAYCREIEESAARWMQ
jgi:hypothetical protein